MKKHREALEQALHALIPPTHPYDRDRFTEDVYEPAETDLGTDVFMHTRIALHEADHQVYYPPSANSFVPWSKLNAERRTIVRETFDFDPEEYDEGGCSIDRNLSQLPDLSDTDLEQVYEIAAETLEAEFPHADADTVFTYFAELGSDIDYSPVSDPHY